MNYIILQGGHAELTTQVNQHLQDGWDLHGSPYVLNNSHFQAMTTGDNPGFAKIESIAEPLKLPTPLADALDNQTKNEKKK